MPPPPPTDCAATPADIGLLLMMVPALVMATAPAPPLLAPALTEPSVTVEAALAGALLPTIPTASNPPPVAMDCARIAGASTLVVVTEAMFHRLTPPAAPVALPAPPRVMTEALVPPLASMSVAMATPPPPVMDCASSPTEAIPAVLIDPASGAADDPIVTPALPDAAPPAAVWPSCEVKAALLSPVVWLASSLLQITSPPPPPIDWASRPALWMADVVRATRRFVPSVFILTAPPAPGMPADAPSESTVLEVPV